MSSVSKDEGIITSVGEVKGLRLSLADIAIGTEKRTSEDAMSPCFG